MINVYQKQFQKSSDIQEWLEIGLILTKMEVINYNISKSLEILAENTFCSKMTQTSQLMFQNES